MSKRTDKLATLVEKGRKYPLNEGVDLVKKCANAKFDESVELTVRLGVDPKQSDQTVRTATVLPHGTGADKRVLVLAKGDKEKEAKDAGADHVGAEETIEKILKGWLDFDTVIATPDMMREVGKLGRILGPKGLMPNPKTGTVTFEVGRVVRESKAGRAEIRNDSYGIVHLAIGKASFAAEQLTANAKAAVEALQRARPASAKGAYLRRVYLSSTHGPGVEVDPRSLEGGEA